LPEEPTAVIEINTNWTKTERPSIPLTTNLCSPRTKTLKATSSQTNKSKEKEWPMFNELQAKKIASQQRNEESPLSAEQPRNRLRKRYHESEQMKKLFADLARDNRKHFREQEEKHTMEIVALKRANLDTQNLLTTKTTPAQTMSDHGSTAHFNAMTKPLDTPLYGTPGNWPAFEHHLLTEAKNPTISMNQDITNFQPN
jgi:hypothetical protein